MRHNHRILPGYAGGVYKEENVISVEVVDCNRQTANHVMWHYANWCLWGNEEDRLAWRGLSGYYGKEDIIRERMRISGRRAGLKNIGRKLSESHKNSIRKSNQGKKHSQGTRDKMSQARSGRPQPDKRKPRTTAVKQKISDALTGKEKSVSHCQRISAANVGIHVGKKWWVNEKNEVKFCHECPGLGWVKGRTWKG
jgi:hypothetical protein